MFDGWDPGCDERTKKESSMKLSLQDFLSAQLRRGGTFEETLLDEARRCEVVLKLTWRDQDFYPADPRLGRLADVIEAPASTVKIWYREHKIRLLADGVRRETGPWDAFEVGPQKLRGYRPWDIELSEPHIPRLEPTEFDDCWVPVRERAHGRNYSELFYLPFWLIQRAPLKGDKKWEQSSIVIDLPWGDSTPMRHRMAFT
jgi:hypothetical protein